MIDESLHETLGEDVALATRLCLDTCFALEDPVTYALILEMLVGDSSAVRVIQRSVAKFQSLGNLREAGVTGFGGSISYLIDLQGRPSSNW